MPKFIADFHIHSKYSRATSQNMVFADSENIQEFTTQKSLF